LQTNKKKRSSSAKGLLRMLTLSRRGHQSAVTADASQSGDVAAAVSASSSQTLVERTFGGKIVISYVCLQCRTESAKSEMFTDLALAFPQDSASDDSDGGAAAGVDPASQRRVNGARLLPGGSATEVLASRQTNGTEAVTSATQVLASRQVNGTEAVTSATPDDDSPLPAVKTVLFH